jgi:hypothetical protein
MKHQIQILALRSAIAVLTPGAWVFWRIAAWHSRLQTQLDNLQSR